MGKITKLANIVAKAARVHKKAMIIDEILERKEGMPYNSKEFYDYVSYWAETDNDVGTGIARALDGGTEEDVKRELCKYIKEQGYNPEICDYINSVNWLEERNDQNVIVGNAFPNEAKRIEDLLKQNNIEYKTSKKGKNIYFEIMFKGKDVWTVNDILNAVLEDRSKFHLVKRANINKKAEEIEPGSIYEKAKAILPKEDIDHHETDLYLRVSPKSTELVNSMKYRNSGMITTFKDNIDGDMWYDLPFCYPYVDSREYRNVPSKEEDEIILRQKKSSKRVKLTKKAESELSDYVEQIRNKGEKVKYEIDKIVERYKYRLDNTFGQADAKKYGIEVYHKLDEAQKLINSIYKIIG